MEYTPIEQATSDPVNNVRQTYRAEDFDFKDSEQEGNYTDLELRDHINPPKPLDNKFVISRPEGTIKISISDNFAPEVVTKLMLGFKEHTKKALPPKQPEEIGPYTAMAMERQVGDWGFKNPSVLGYQNEVRDFESGGTTNIPPILRHIKAERLEYGKNPTFIKFEADSWGDDTGEPPNYAAHWEEKK